MNFFETYKSVAKDFWAILRILDEIVNDEKLSRQLPNRNEYLRRIELARNALNRLAAVTE